MDPTYRSTQGGTFAEAAALSGLLADCRSDGLSDLFATLHLPTPMLLWRPKFVDLQHPVLKGFQRALGPPTNGKYPREWLDGADFEAIEESMIVLEPIGTGQDFVYRHYGTRIGKTAGRDMTDRRVSDFAADCPEIAVFFLAVYNAVLRRGESVKSHHAAPLAAFTRQWRRLIVPLVERSGAITRIAVACAADNELRPGLEILPDGVVVADANGRLAFANRSARRLFDIGAASISDLSVSQFMGMDVPLPARPEDVILERNRMRRRVRKVQGATIVPLELTIGASYFRDESYFVIVVREVAPTGD